MRLSSFEQACARSYVLSARPSIQSDARVSVRMYVYYINDRVFFSSFILTLLLTCFVLARECMCAYAHRSPSVCCKHICTPARPSGPSVFAYVRKCLR